MNAAAPTPDSGPDIHRRFEAALPRMEDTFRFQFRRRTGRHRAQAIADARAAAWHAWHGLLARGKDPTAVGPTGIASNACRYVKAGRRLGTGPVGRHAMDVYHRRAREMLGFGLVGLEHGAGGDAVRTDDGRREWLAAGGRSTPADEAAFRIDFAAWLAALPPRRRRVAELLAEGHGTGEVAALLGVTPGAISQARSWLEHSWRRLQGEASETPCSTHSPRRRRTRTACCT
jgi:hypothetical protein